MNEVIIYIAKSKLPLPKEKQWHTKWGRTLLHQALSELTPNTVLAEEIETHAQGKPYLKNSPFHFNISHSHAYVVCAIGPEELGIDIQHHKSSGIERLAKRTLTPEEWQDFLTAFDNVQFFYDRWSEKESYLKYTGEGIRSDMRSLTIDKVLTHIPVDIEYSCTLCTKSNLPYRLLEANLNQVTF